jgi:hypothetical protein
LKDVDDAVKDSAGEPGDVGVTLWNTVLDLIYTGHSDLAWRFVREANPNAIRGKNPALAEFCSKLSSSPYWDDLKPTVKDIPVKCAKVIGRASR